MKRIFVTIACLQIFASLHAQGITLLYKKDMGWNNPLSWIQINTPSGQTPIQRVPNENDDVVISSSMSGISSVGFETDFVFNIGGSSPDGPSQCRSMHVSNTVISFDDPSIVDGAPTLNIYTSNGGFVIIDSGSNVRHGFFQLHGGNPAVTDLQILHSTYGTLFSHARWSGISWDVGGRAKLVGSTLGGTSIGSSSGGNIYIDSCTFNTQNFILGDNSTDTLLHCLIQDDLNNIGLNFFIGRNAGFVSDSVQIEPMESLGFTTSGSVLNGNIRSHFIPGNISFLQEDTLHRLPNILNGNLVTNEAEHYSVSGDLKISGDFICNGSVGAFNDSQNSDSSEHYFNCHPV